MTQQVINVGLLPDDGTGDNLRATGIKVNANFNEAYATTSALAPLPGLGWYPATAFGVVGNGVADDTAALQAIFTAVPVGGGTVVLQPGLNIRITAQVNVPNPTTIIGWGAKITVATAGIIGMQIRAADSAVLGLSFVGSDTGATQGIALQMAGALQGFACQRCDVEACSFSGFNQSISNVAANDCTISSNKIRNTIGTGSGQGYGIITSGADTVITGNMIRNVQRHGVYVSGIVGAGATRASVTGNYIQTENAISNSAAINVFAFSSQPVLEGVTVVGNTILVSTPTAAEGISFVENVRSCTCSANSIIGANVGGIVVVGGPTVAPDHINIVGNTIDMAAGDALLNGTGGGPAPTDCAWTNNIIRAGTLTDGGTRTYRRGNHRTAGAMQGRAVLVAGTVTVATAEVVAADNIQLTTVLQGGTTSFVFISGIIANTSFTIQSNTGADTGTIFWEIVH